MQFDRVAITGGCGRLGRYVVRELEHSSVLTLLDRKGKSASHLPVCHVDVLDFPALCEAVKGHEAVIHLAAADASADVTADLTFKTNVVGTWNVLEAAHRAEIRKVVVCSSTSAAGFQRGNLPQYLPIDEFHPAMPAGPYCLSKVIAETVAETFARTRQMKIVCLRPSYITFPEIIDSIVAKVGTAKEEGIGEPGVGGPFEEGLSPHRSYVRPEDAARCFRLALEFDGPLFRKFIVTASDSYSPKPILDFCRDLFGTLPEIRDPKRWERDPFASVMDNSAAREALGWRPQGLWRDLVAARAARTA